MEHDETKLCDLCGRTIGEAFLACPVCGAGFCAGCVNAAPFLCPICGSTLI